MSFHYYHLKYIALFTMIIDHVTVIFQSFLSPEVYYILRGVGRLSFPIYCFLLAEGFFHTRNRYRYLIRLSIFALISELPFDLALFHSYLYMDPDNIFTGFRWANQNVFFTLAFGFASMMLLESMSKFYQLRFLAPIGVFLAILAADYLGFDYGSVGVVTILLFYFYIKNKKNRPFPMILCFLPLALLSLSAPIQLACLFSFLPIWCYNGEKGHGPKYLFYIAYPAHLLIALGIFLLVS